MRRWLRPWLRRRAVEREMDAELRLHYDLLVEEFEGQGIAPQEARRRARLEFGGLEQAKDDSREALQVQQGSLYPVLYRLEERGYIEGEWRETDQGRMAKFYSVTRKGAKELEDGRTEWQRTAAAIASVLEAAQC